MVPHCSDVQRVEERVEVLPQVLDLLHALAGPATELTTPCVLLGVLQLDPERLLHLVHGQRVLDRAALVRLLELVVGLLLGLEEDPVGRDLRVATQRLLDDVLLRLGDVLARVAAGRRGMSWVHRKIEISILSYQRPFIRSTCWLASSPAPNSDSETHMVMMTARVMVRFCRRPPRVSEKMWRKRIS